MSNGGQCCAIEVCCDGAALRTKLPAMVAKHAGVAQTAASDEVLGQLQDFMETEGIAFAPASVKPFIQEVLAAERRHVAHGKDEAV